MLPTIFSDSYKQSHYQMYPKGLTKLYSNFTARGSRLKDVNQVVFFGLQYFLLEYLIKQFNEEFFNRPKQEVIDEHIRLVNPFSTGKVHTEQWEALHDLGYLPLKIKAVKEGTFVPIGVPMLTVTNTHPDFAWLVNFIETILSTSLWQAITSATIANEYRKITTKWANETGGDLSFIDWQNHDFSMRGMSSLESAMLSGAGHLTSFKGSDTIPALVFLEKYYNATGLIAGSVGATEHSVMSCGGKEDEIKTFERLLDTFPEGILSIVSDTWNLWKVLTDYLPKLKDKIMSRNGKIVIRPDSGIPEDIICGSGTHPERPTNCDTWEKYLVNKRPEWKFTESEYKGVIELLWETFGGTINEKGYKVLDPHIGAIYGDSITLERANEICSRLESKGFCSTNIVFGIGSFTYNYNTRDTFGMAMKATYCEITPMECPRGACVYGIEEACDHDGCANELNVECRAIFKDPITDNGSKKSARGLLMVQENGSVPAKLELVQDVTWEQEAQGELEVVFENSKLIRRQSLEEIRNLIKSQI